MGPSLYSIRSGVAVVGLLLFTVGCSQFPAKRFARPYIRDHNEDPVAFAPEVEQSQFNSVQLTGLPARVQYAFLHEHPAASITAVQTVPSGSGPMLYRVAYVEAGMAQSTTYADGGRDLSHDQRETIIRQDDSGRPKATYAPANGSASAGIPPRGTPAGDLD